MKIKVAVREARTADVSVKTEVILLCVCGLDVMWWSTHSHSTTRLVDSYLLPVFGVTERLHQHLYV